MSTVPNAATVNQSPQRSLTPSEASRLVTDSWTQMNIRLTPGKLHTNCFHRVDDYMVKYFPDVKSTVLELVWHDYAGAVKVLADGYYRSATSEALFFNEDALQWITPHPAIAKRKQRDLEQRGLTRKPEADEFDVAAKNQATQDNAKSDKIERQAQTDAGVAIDKILFTNVRGIDNRKTDELRAELRAYVEEHKDKKKWSDILSYVTAKIAQAYKTHERDLEKWNSR
jgi:hypothetical protein